MSRLSQIRSLVTVDVDSMDPDVAKWQSENYEKFHDMTSNQAIVYFQAAKDHSLIRKTIELVRKESPGWYQDPTNQDHDLQDAVDVLTVLLAKEVYPYLDGKVHAQISPLATMCVENATEKTIQHAQKLVALFDKHGIKKDRVCIKIPATPESIIACEKLSQLNINTLATCVFSVAQAQAAAQAGCLYVAPYFNELNVHFDKQTWEEYKDPAKEHPMSPVIQSIICALKESKTLVMPASIVSVPEVMALVSFRPAHITLSASILRELNEVPALTDGVPIAPNPNVSPPQDLIKAWAADKEMRRKVDQALNKFGEFEENTKKLIRDVLAEASSIFSSIHPPYPGRA